MKDFFTNHNDLTEIVFENRHKAYGAYQLRARYDQTMRRSLFSSIAGLILLGIIALITRSKADETSGSDIVIPYTFDNTKYEIIPDEFKQPGLPKQAATLPAAATVKSTELEIVPDKEVIKHEVPPTAEELDGKVAGTETSENPEGQPGYSALQGGGEGGSENGGENGSVQTLEKTFISVAEMPEYEGGLQKMYKFIGKNLHYPEMALENYIQGTVTVSFVVEKDGSVYNASILKGIGGGCDEEAKRVVKLLRFKPGRQNGQPVKVQFSLPIKFNIN